MTASERALVHAVRIELARRAASADPPVDALERFHVRLAGRRAGTIEVVDDAASPDVHGSADRADVALGDDGEREVELMHDPSDDPRQRHWARWVLVAIAAALVAALIALAARDDADVEPVDEQPAPVDAALSMLDSYFDAFAAGEVGEVMALFTPEATFTDLLREQTRSQFESVTAWEIAQGNALRSPRCTARQVAFAVEVTCTYADDNYLARVAGAPPVAVTSTATVTPEGITGIVLDYDQEGYTSVENRFVEWLAVNHPDELAEASCCGGSSVEESQVNAALRVRYADEWAAFLDARGCRYDSCPPGAG